SAVGLCLGCPQFRVCSPQRVDTKTQWSPASPAWHSPLGSCFSGGQDSYAPGAVFLPLILGTLTPMAQQDKISILGPREDGTYVVEFRTAAGERLAISVPETKATVLKHFQAALMHRSLMWAS